MSRSDRRRATALAAAVFVGCAAVRGRLTVAADGPARPAAPDVVTPPAAAAAAAAFGATAVPAAAADPYETYVA
ncbi:MAG: hypothetical protein JWO31_3650, partial [Phycisphaerales bacterium]|nr:hypothetical protein [Phycisphaerales bacterium]